MKAEGRRGREVWVQKLNLHARKPYVIDNCDL